MKAVLTQYDRFCIERLKEMGLFAVIEPKKLEISSGGIIFVPCGDCDQFPDMYSHMAGICRVLQIVRIHPVVLNGGGILMSGQLLSEQTAHGNVMMENILAASKIKGIKDVLIYTHFPCAIAHGCGLGVVDQARYLMEAKNRLKEASHDLEIRCFFHIDKYDEQEGGSHKRRTYFMPKQSWTGEALTEVLHKLRAAF